MVEGIIVERGKVTNPGVSDRVFNSKLLFLASKYNPKVLLDINTVYGATNAYIILRFRPKTKAKKKRMVQTH